LILGVHILEVDPRVVSGGVSFSVNEILLLSVPKGSCLDDLFYFLFRSVINNVRRGLEIVWAMFGCFVVRGKKGSMEDIMDPPCFREVELVCHV
jgi:hypothetical protein